MLYRLLPDGLVLLSAGVTVVGADVFGLTGYAGWWSLLSLSAPLFVDPVGLGTNLAFDVLVCSIIAFKLGLTESGAFFSASSSIASVLAALAFTFTLALRAAAVTCLPDLPDCEPVRFSLLPVALSAVAVVPGSTSGVVPAGAAAVVGGVGTGAGGVMFAVATAVVVAVTLAVAAGVVVAVPFAVGVATVFALVVVAVVVVEVEAETEVDGAFTVVAGAGAGIVAGAGGVTFIDEVAGTPCRAPAVSSLEASILASNCSAWSS